MPATVVVQGFEELQRAIARSGPAVKLAMDEGLRRGAEPVRALAGLYARRNISGMKRAQFQPPPWSVMRVGVTNKIVYVAPAARGVKTRNPFDPRRRPNLFDLIMNKALDPASIAGEPLVARSVEALLDGLIERGF